MQDIETLQSQELERLRDSVATLEEMVNQGEMIQECDLEYHFFLVDRLEEVQTAIRFWMDHLARKYQLNQGDTVSPEGVIVRSSHSKDSKLTRQERPM